LTLSRVQDYEKTRLDDSNVVYHTH
jgi:hypothetical protein